MCFTPGSLRSGGSHRCARGELAEFQSSEKPAPSAAGIGYSPITANVFCKTRRSRPVIADSACPCHCSADSTPCCRVQLKLWGSSGPCQLSSESGTVERLCHRCPANHTGTQHRDCWDVLRKPMTVSKDSHPVLGRKWLVQEARPRQHWECPSGDASYPSPVPAIARAQGCHLPQGWCRLHYVYSDANLFPFLTTLWKTQAGGTEALTCECTGVAPFCAPTVGCVHSTRTSA